MTEEVKAYEMEEVYGHVQRDGKDFYVTKDRIWIQLVDFNPMIVEAARREHPIPKRPTYQVRAMGGRMETHSLDEVSAQDNPQDKARWEMYLEERAEADSKRNSAFMRVIFGRGTEFDVPSGWEENQEDLGITVPTKPLLRKVHYLETELDPSDLQGLLSVLTKRLGVSEAEVKEAEDSFRA